MHSISMANWILLATEYESVPLSYFDEEMDHINHECFIAYADDLLSSIIDEKETAKLENLIEKFEYQDKKFECDVIELARKMLSNKPHMAMHTLQKIYEVALFKSG